jgi:hypothetical protein
MNRDAGHRNGTPPVEATEGRSAGLTQDHVANRNDLSYDEHPFFGLVVRDLERSGIPIGAASLP